MKKTQLVDVPLLAALILISTQTVLCQIMPNVRGNAGSVVCPEVMCIQEFIPDDCKVIPEIVIDGKTCFGCPQWKPGCNRSSGSRSKPSDRCPEVICTLEMIPDECREIPKIQVNELQCNGCPKWRDGCKAKTTPSSQKGKQTPRVACPLLRCPGIIPRECLERKTFVRTSDGRVCSKCPEWRMGCREPEREVYMATPKGAAPKQCPKVVCAEKVPTECQEETPYDFHHLKCFGCPKWKAGCQDRPVLPQEETKCPLIECQLTPGVHRTCYQREYFSYKGIVCEKCASINPRCLQTLPPRPIVSVEKSRDSNRKGEVACPMIGCPTMKDIPSECREIPMLPIGVGGKLCQGCPIHREGCVPSNKLSDIVPKEPRVMPVGGGELACPLKACTLMLIPPECRDEQPYDFNGKTCYDCPRWRDNCNPNSGSGSANNAPKQPEVACPMFGCPRIYIPKECRDEQPFQFQGKTCYRCPKWRKDCVPGGNTPQVLPMKPRVPEVACPLKRCQMDLSIPSECLEAQTFEFQGKTCADCPKRRANCPSKTTTTTAATPKAIIAIDRPSDFVTAPPLFPTSDASLFSDLNGVLPLNDIFAQINALTCPMLPCPDMLMPDACRQETWYTYEGRRCRGCPRWRLGCQVSASSPMNFNANGILSFGLFNEMFI